MSGLPGEFDPQEQRLCEVIRDVRALIRLASYHGYTRESLVDGSSFYAPTADLTVEEFEADNFRVTARVDISREARTVDDWQETRYFAQIEGVGRAATTNPSGLTLISAETSRNYSSGLEISRPYIDEQGTRLARATLQAAANRTRAKLNGSLGQSEAGSDDASGQRFGRKVWSRHHRY